MDDPPHHADTGSNSDLPIYAVNRPDEGGGREQHRANAISRIGATDATAPGTFFPPELDGSLDFRASFSEWLETVFVPGLGPAFVTIHLAAARMETERILAADREIDQFLSATARRRNIAAAESFLEGRTEIRSQPQWVKFRKAIDTGDTPGHLTSLFSLQAALFHLPLLPALTAFVHLEGVNGLAAMAGGERIAFDLFAARHTEGAEAARKVFQRGWSDFPAEGEEDPPGNRRLASL